METYAPNKKILYVDDEQALLDAFASLMRKQDVAVQTLQDSTQIQATLDRGGPFAVVLSDQRMPGVDGVGVLEAVGRHCPATVRVLVTGYADQHDTQRAINIGGIAYYVNKPWVDEDLKRLVKECVERYNLAEENRYLLNELSGANRALKELLEGTVGGTSRLLSDLVGFVNADAASHAARVRQLGTAVLKMVPDMSAEERWAVERALELCYLGVAVLPAWIQVSLNKQGLGALERFPVAKNHHMLAAGLLKDIPRFSEVARIIRLQAKDYNGYGEPLDERVHGKDLPFGSRLLHILLEVESKISEHIKGRAVLQRMSDQPSKYDVDIISLMLKGPESISRRESETDLELDDLQPGMELIEDILSEGGQCLLRAGSSLTETSISILKQWDKKDPVTRKVRIRRGVSAQT